LEPATRASLDEIKARHLLQEVAPRYVADLRHTGTNLIGCCPFHDDAHPSFAVHLPTQTWHCYAASCDLGGDVIDLVGNARFGRAWNSRDKSMFKEALHDLEGGQLPPLRQAVPPAWQNPKAWRPVELSPRVQMLLHTAARLYHTTLLAMDRGPGTPYQYLLARGFSDATIRQEAIGYAMGDLLIPALLACGLSISAAAEINLLDAQRQYREFMTGRVVFMERDRNGRVLHLIGRAFSPLLSDHAPKYLSLKEMTKPLYGYARLDRRESDRPVVLVESPPDAITARQWGFDAVANVGARMKNEHAVLLNRLKRPLVIVPHNDGGVGLAAAQRWRELVGRGTLAELPDQVKDVNVLGTLEGGEREFLVLMKAHGFERKPPLKRLAGQDVPSPYTQQMAWAETLLSSQL
jgi:DNA primase